MAYPTPNTAKVVALLSDARFRARVAFLVDGTDGVMNEVGAGILTLIDEALACAEAADDGRKAALALLNVNEVTDWHQRQWRERNDRRNGPVAA